MLDEVLPVRIRLGGHFRLLGIPQLMACVIDDPHHHGVNADWRQDRRRIDSRRAHLRRRLRWFGRRAAAGGETHSESPHQRIVQFVHVGRSLLNTNLKRV
jgi:hypothetical protein